MKFAEKLTVLARATFFITLVAATPARSAEVDLSAHEHGVARLDLVAEGSTLLIALESPAQNLVGFETRPHSDQQRALVNTTLEALRDPANSFRFAGGNNCKLVHGEARWLDGDDHHDDEPEQAGDAHETTGGADERHGHDDDHETADHGHEDDHEMADDDKDSHGGHSEIRVKWEFDCPEETLPTELDVLLFSAYPAVREIIVRGAMPNGQIGATLTPDSSSIVLP